MNRITIVVLGLMIIGLPISAAEIFSSEESSIDLSGRIKMRSGFVGDEFIWDNEGSRLTIKGNKIIDEGLSVFGVVEWGFDPLEQGAGAGISGRLGYVGVDLKGHIVILGQQDSLYDSIDDYTDQFEVEGGSAHNNKTNYGGNRAKGAMYSSKVGLFNIAVHGQMDNGHVENGSDWSTGGAIEANLGAANLGLAVQYADMRAHDEEALLMLLGTKWSIRKNLNMAVTGSYQKLENNATVLGQESYIGYTYDLKGSTLYGGNNYQRDLDLNSNEVNYLTIGGTYNILPGSSFYVFAEANFDLEDFNNESRYWVGTRYSF